jgi:hypothetical protein
MSIRVDMPAGEIEIEVSGTLIPYRPATREDPEEGGVEDVEITALRFLVPNRGPERTTWHGVDLLEGIDAAAKERVLANLQKLMDEDELRQALEAGQ